MTNDWVNSNNKPDLQLVAGFIVVAEGANAANNIGAFLDLVGVQDDKVRQAIARASE